MKAGLAAGLLALYAANAALAATPAPASPACALLNAAEVAAVLGAGATVEDGGPAASGVSACGWRGKSAVTLSVQVLAPVAFASAATTAETYYGLIVEGMRAAHQPGEEVPGMGEKAYLVTIDPGATPGFVMTILNGGKIATVSAIGLAKPDAIAAARQIAERF